jgi:hypothetical protein
LPKVIFSRRGFRLSADLTVIARLIAAESSNYNEIREALLVGAVGISYPKTL